MKELYQIFKTYFYLGIGVFLFSIAMLFLPYMIELPENCPQIVLFAHFLIVMIVIVQIGVSLIPYAKDYFLYVRKKSYKKMIGKVISYQKEETEGKNPTTVHNPVVLDETTGEELIMKIKNEKDAVIGKTYTFLYLEHTKIAVISKSKFSDGQ